MTASAGRANPSRGLAPAIHNSPANSAAPHAAAAFPRNPVAKSGALGGPRAEGYARLGGPAYGKAARAGLDGTGMPRRQH
jgi:hypothetical protein